MSKEAKASGIDDESKVLEGRSVSRRQFLKLAGAAGAMVGVGGLGGALAACGGGSETTTTAAAGGTTVSVAAETGRSIKIGLVTPKTGSMATFGIADDWWVPFGLKAIGDGVVMGDKKMHKIEILVRDTQSDSNRAAQVAGDLILNEGADMLMASGAPDTVVPVADTCEANSTPGLFNASPWQATFARESTPKEGYKWIWGQCMGSEDTILNYSEMFDQVPNNKIVGMLLPNNADGAAWQAPTGAPAVFEAKGYKLVVPALYPTGSEDFTAQIAAFKKGGCEIICGTNVPPDFVNFVKQSLQQGFKPKLMSTGNALLFPDVPNGLSSALFNLIGEMPWSPDWTFKDSLSGMTCREMADDFETKMKQQWTVTIGDYCKLEWAVDIFKRATNPEDKEAVIAAIPQTNLMTCSGTIDFTQAVDPTGRRPMINNVKPNFAGGQWIKGTGKWKVDLVECSNAAAPETEVQATTLEMVYL
jgi:branched-chain amino acid transport system substrate-binding protein